MKQISYIKDIEEWRKGFSFYIPIKIRFSETDMFGHVNNVSPFIYFEEARIDYLKSHGLFGDLNEEGMPIVSDLQCDYHRQIFLNNELKLYVKTNTVGNTSFDLHYMAINEKDEICLTGRGRMVNVNVKTGKPLELSQQMKDKFLE
ncbi:acyl-CoA thioesterase [Cerasibacillus terrae]|uniref:Acyl-CoA thioesterase n=1 Tax=Cerasibacillus terrae TaxID=2498845 RepID=A0A5C8NN78_9BACI|nr:thioesterase family protein [Cerasibacillus terrae]TXL62540.1 acyl-CoA thioesterase [Cerasibacillus terrae]